MKSKILTVFCAGILALSGGMQSAKAQTSSWFNDKDLTLTGVYYYPEHWDESQWERDFKKMHELGFEFTHFAEFAWAQLEPEEGRYDFSWLDKAVALAAKYDLTDSKAKDSILKTDKKRASYYNYYSNKKWGDAASYQLCIDSSVCGIDGSVEAILNFVALKEAAAKKK